MFGKVSEHLRRITNLGDDETVIIDAENVLNENAAPSDEARGRVGELEVAGPVLPRLEHVQNDIELPQGDDDSVESAQDSFSYEQIATDVELDLEVFRKKQRESFKLIHVYAVCRSEGVEYPPLECSYRKDTEKYETFMTNGKKWLNEAAELRAKNPTFSSEDQKEYKSKLEQSHICFTKAVAHASHETNELAEAFRYRAQVLMKMNDFIDALVDLHRCVGLNASAVMLIEMDRVRAECYQSLRDEKGKRGLNAPTYGEAASIQAEASESAGVSAPAKVSKYKWSLARVIPSKPMGPLEDARPSKHKKSPVTAGLLSSSKSWTSISSVVDSVSASTTSPCTSTSECDKLTPDGRLNEIDIVYRDVDEDGDTTEDGDVTEDEDDNMDEKNKNIERNEKKKNNKKMKNKNQKGVAYVNGPISIRNTYNSWSSIGLKKKTPARHANRSLTAKENMDPGDWLMSVRAFASILDVKYFKTHCSNCTLRSQNLFPCHNCSLVMYCCARCQKSAWEKYHRIECQYLPHMVSANRPRDEILALRILMVLTWQGKKLVRVTTKIPDPFTRTGFNQMRSAMGSDYEAILRIVIPFDEIDAQMQYDRYRATFYLLQMLKQTTYFRYVEEEVSAYLPTLPNKKMTKRELLATILLHKCMWVARFSSHPIIGSEERISRESTQLKSSRQVCLGDAVYPVLALNVLQHSCRPNVTIVNFKNGAHLFTTKPIKKFEQLTYSFGGAYFNTMKQKRADTMKDKYHKMADWYCKCEACKEKWKCERSMVKHFPKYHLLKYLNKRGCDNLRRLKIAFRDLWKKYKKDKIILDTSIVEVYKYSTLLHKYVKEEFRDFAQCQILIEHYLNLGMDRALVDFLEQRETETVFKVVPKEEISR